LQLLEHVLGGNTVQSIWERAWRQIAARVAVEARKVVPHEVVREWLTREVNVDHPHRADEVFSEPEVTLDGGDSLGSPLEDIGIGSDDPDRQVLRGLRLLAHAAADRDLAEQLGVADTAANFPMWLLPPSRWL